MFCTHCGAQLEEGVRFCSVCGKETRRSSKPAPVPHPPAPEPVPNPIPVPEPQPAPRRSGTARKLVAAAVCLLLAAGLIAYFSSDHYHSQKANAFLENEDIASALDVLEKMDSPTASKMADYLTCRTELLSEEDPETALGMADKFLKRYRAIQTQDDKLSAAQAERDAGLYAQVETVSEVWKDYLDMDTGVSVLYESVLEDERLRSYDPDTEEHGPGFTAAGEQTMLDNWALMRSDMQSFLDSSEYGVEFRYLQELVEDSESYSEAVQDLIDAALESYPADTTVYYNGTPRGRFYSASFFDEDDPYVEKVRRQAAQSLAHALQHPRILGTGTATVTYGNDSAFLYYQVLADQTIEITGCEPQYGTLTELHIPEAIDWKEGGGQYPVTRIAPRAFQGNEDLQTVYLPQNIDSIERLAFADCSALMYIMLPDGWSYISVMAFDGSSEMSLECSEESYDRMWNECGFTYGSFSAGEKSGLYQRPW